nr:glutathione s-transferase theta-1 [Protohermes costalis]
MALKVYYDLLSQPSRALVMFLQASKVPFEHRRVALKKGEHFTDEYKNISRFQKVPAIDDNGFKLAESVAIMRYLVREKLVPEHWYPRDSKKQALVDEYLEWQHNNTRLHCSWYFRAKWIEPIMAGTPANPRRIEHLERRMSECLDSLEELWLRNNDYLVGDRISIADLLGACEVEQPRIAGYEPRDGRPKLTAWLDRIRTEMNPHYDEVHSEVNKLADKYQGQAPIKMASL